MSVRICRSARAFGGPDLAKYPLTVTKTATWNE